MERDEIAKASAGVPVEGPDVPAYVVIVGDCARPLTVIETNDNRSELIRRNALMQSPVIHGRRPSKIQGRPQTLNGSSGSILSGPCVAEIISCRNYQLLTGWPLTVAAVSSSVTPVPSGPVDLAAMPFPTISHENPPPVT